jgi:hypothetical protein
MDGESALQTLAQIAISLAGFGGLMVVLRRDPSGPLSVGESMDLALVVGGSLLALLFALLPLPLFHFGLSEPIAWQLASILFGIALSVLHLRLAWARLVLPGPGVQPIWPRLTRAATWLPLGLALTLVPAALGVLRGITVGLYLQALLVLLIVSAFPMVGIAVRLTFEIAERNKRD